MNCGTIYNEYRARKYINSTIHTFNVHTLNLLQIELMSITIYKKKN